MDSRIEKLKTMQTTSLIDVAKNYKKYNYPETIKDAALIVLEERGVKQESLKISGKLTNIKYEDAIHEYKKYNVNSIFGLILFCVSMFIYSTNDWGEQHNQIEHFQNLNSHHSSKVIWTMIKSIIPF